jgi:hypothetical protein
MGQSTKEPTMQKQALTALAVFLTFAMSPPAPAQSTLPKTVAGAEVQKKVTRLTNLVHWHSDLEEAKKIARQEKKGIFWLHALGDLDGDC